MPPAAQIVFPAGVTWTTGTPDADATAGQVAIYRNGVKVKGSVNYLLLKAGVIYNFDPPAPLGSGAGWERWTGTGWAATAAP